MCEIRRSALHQQSHPEPAQCRCTASHSWSAMPRCDAGARAHSRTQVGHAVHMRAGPLRRVQRRPLRERGPHAARHERRQQSGKARRARRAQGEAKHGKEVWVRHCTEREVLRRLTRFSSPALPQRGNCRTHTLPTDLCPHAPPSTRTAPVPAPLQPTSPPPRMAAPAPITVQLLTGQVISIPSTGTMTAFDILDLVEMETGLALRLIWKGAQLKDDDFVAPGAELHAVFRLRGGAGERFAVQVTTASMLDARVTVTVILVPRFFTSRPGADSAAAAMRAVIERATAGGFSDPALPALLVEGIQGKTRSLSLPSRLAGAVDVTAHASAAGDGAQINAVFTSTRRVPLGRSRHTPTHRRLATPLRALRRACGARGSRVDRAKPFPL